MGTLLIVIMVVLLLCGGGYYGRWRYWQKLTEPHRSSSGPFITQADWLECQFQGSHLLASCIGLEQDLECEPRFVLVC